MLACGEVPTLAALALMGTIVPTTYTGHRFWEEPDAEKRAQQRTQLLKNLGLLGGLIFAAVDTDGAPSVAWRTRRRVRQVASSVTEAHANSDAHGHQTSIEGGRCKSKGRAPCEKDGQGGNAASQRSRSPRGSRGE